MAAAPTTTPATTPATTGTRDAPARLELTRRPGTGPDAVLLADHGVDLRGALVVEAGCGSGHNTAHLAGLGARAVGVDLDHARLARARASYGRVPGAEFVHAEAAAYLRGLPARTADAVLSVFGAFSFHPAGPCSARAPTRCGPAACS